MIAAGQRNASATGIRAVGARRQPQFRLDLAGELIAEIKQPAAAERKLVVRRWLVRSRLPRRIERVEEIGAATDLPQRVANAAVAIEPELIVGNANRMSKRVRAAPRATLSSSAG